MLDNQEINYLPSNIAIYITDQSHPSQIDKLPENAVPGFSVTVYKLKGKKPTTLLESHYSKTLDQAKYIAKEYARQYATVAALRSK